MSDDANVPTSSDVCALCVNVCACTRVCVYAWEDG